MHRPSRSGNSGRFIDPMLDIGCTPLLRATMGGDAEVVRALLAKGAYPNINAMGLTPFLVAAGVGAGNIGGTGLAAQTSAGGPVNMELMELLLQHGANVNDQVTGTLTYSMRVSRAPSANEGRTALHIAAQEGKTDLVRYLLAKGATQRSPMPPASGNRLRQRCEVRGEALRQVHLCRRSREPGNCGGGFAAFSRRPPGSKRESLAETESLRTENCFVLHRFRRSTPCRRRCAVLR
jgi:ankyrin repeat protein